MAAVQEIHVGDSAARVQQIAPVADELPDIHGEKMVLNMGP